MTTYKDIITDQGFLSENGKKVLQEKFLPAVQELLTLTTSENEIRVMSSVLSNLIGKTTANLVQQYYDHKEDINEMSNEDFETYLKNKYQNFNLATSPITDEEMKRFAHLAMQQVKEAMQEGFQNIIRDDQYQHLIDPFEALPLDTKEKVVEALKATDKSKQHLNTLLDDLLEQIPTKSKK